MKKPLDDPLTQPTLAAASVPDETTRLQWEKACRSGANWFYWVAGLSMVNTALFLIGSDTAFIFGLGVTQVVDGIVQVFAEEAGRTAYLFGAMFNLAIVGVVALFGLLANQRKPWAFALGMFLYALDGAVFLLVSDWLSLGFHVFVLYALAIGWSAAVKVNRVPQSVPLAGFAARAS